MMFQVLSILLVIVTGVLCSGTQQGVSSTQAGHTLQIQSSNARKYNKHTTTEKPCTTGSTTGTRKDKPESADTQDYVAIGGAPGPGYPYHPSYPYPVQGGRPVQQYYPYEPQYPVVETVPPPGSPYYAAIAPPPYYPAASAPPPPPYYPAPGSTYAAALPYPPAAYPAPSQQQLYEQSTVVDAYRSPPAYLQQADGPQQPSLSQQQFYRQPGIAAPYYYPSYNYRAHTYNRLAAAPTPPAFLQQRDATGAAAATAAANNVEPSAAQQLQYEQQQSSSTGGGQFDGVNQFHHY